MTNIYPVRIGKENVELSGEEWERITIWYTFTPYVCVGRMLLINQ